jgi:serine-type D-Ala-D-Ala carboxypeptidase
LNVDFTAVTGAVHEAVAGGVFPGAVLLVGRGDEVLYEQSFGTRFAAAQTKAPLKNETIYDLASLTKPLATTVALMLLLEQKKIDLQEPVARVLPTFGIYEKDRVTFRQLLNHSSGLPAWKPFYESVLELEKFGRATLICTPKAKAHVFEQIHREKLLAVPGTQSLYSDLGFMILGQAIEIIAGQGLDDFCERNIYRRLGLESMRFINLAPGSDRPSGLTLQMIAPTERCPWRKKVICGEVHDDNAYVMGGVAGHAGLFSTARDIHSLIACLDRCLHNRDSFLSQGILREFLTRDESVEGARFALGWDTPSPGKTTSGSYFSAWTVGHLGFTGTSIWWDLEKDCHIILLSNRVHPSRRNEKIKSFRPYIHDLTMKAVFCR